MIMTVIQQRSRLCSGGLSFMERIAVVPISTDFYGRFWSIALILYSTAIPGGFQNLFSSVPAKIEPPIVCEFVFIHCFQRHNAQMLYFPTFFGRLCEERANYNIQVRVLAFVFCWLGGWHAVYRMEHKENALNISLTQVEHQFYKQLQMFGL